jgi:hypothetical protein
MRIGPERDRPPAPHPDSDPAPVPSLAGGVVR